MSLYCGEDPGEDERGEGQRFSCVLEFDSDEPAFTRGFEAGIMWSFAANTGYFCGVIHTANAEMALRIAESLRLPIRAEDHPDTAFVKVTVGTPATDEDEDDE